MSELIVADSGPIISLARIRRLHLVSDIFGKIMLPQSVYEEIVIKGKGKPGESEIRDAQWVSVQKAKNQIEVRKLRKQFDSGESEAIVLAEELKATILADEWIVIREARKRGLLVISTLLILVEAKKRDLIKSIQIEIDHLIESGFRITPELVKAVLKMAEEQN